MNYTIHPFKTIESLAKIKEEDLIGWELPISKEICHKIESKNSYGSFKFDAPPGSNVKASKDGLVFLINKNNQSKWNTGNRIILDHGEGIYSRYENLSKQYFDELDIKEGKRVKQNQIIGVLGLPSHLFFNGFVYIQGKEDSIMKQKVIPIKLNHEELINKSLSYKDKFN